MSSLKKAFCFLTETGLQAEEKIGLGLFASVPYKPNGRYDKGNGRKGKKMMKWLPVIFQNRKMTCAQRNGKW